MILESTNLEEALPFDQIKIIGWLYRADQSCLPWLTLTNKIRKEQN